MMPPGRRATPVLESLTFYVQIDFTEAKRRELQESWIARAFKSIYGTEQNIAGLFELFSRSHVVFMYLDVFRSI
jgi:hypothetical protein